MNDLDQFLSLSDGVANHPPGSRDGCPTIRSLSIDLCCGARVSRAGRAGGLFQ
jgi:hypothetical protein